MDGAIWILIPLTALMIPISAIWTSHVRELAKIRSKGGENLNAASEARIAALQKEVAELRDTSTKFDVALDAALSRLEERMDRNEERSVSRYTTTTESEKVAAGQGR